MTIEIDKKNYTTIAFNKRIEVDRNLQPLRALGLARAIIKKEKLECKVNEIGFIYIIQQSVSDLIVIKDNKTRKCNDREWSWYFNNVLYPKQSS